MRKFGVSWFEVPGWQMGSNSKPGDKVYLLSKLWEDKEVFTLGLWRGQSRSGLSSVCEVAFFPYGSCPAVLCIGTVWSWVISVKEQIKWPSCNSHRWAAMRSLCHKGCGWELCEAMWVTRELLRIFLLNSFHCNIMDYCVEGSILGHES